MTDSPDYLYLIAHKVRGEPAFDVAIQMPCPLCQDYESVTGARCEAERSQEDCVECDRVGFWWIISTSGHRAYPWWHTKLENIDDTYELSFEPTMLEGPGSMPPDLPDHYTAPAEPRTPRPAFLTSLLAKPHVRIPRRGL